MSARLTTDPAARDVLAAEFVIGTLDARTAIAVGEALTQDRSLRVAVEGWEDRMTALAGTVPQAAPPADLWARIEARLPADPVRQAARRPVASSDVRLGRAAWLWRAWAIGASMAAAVFAGIAFVQTNQPARQEATALPAAPAAPGAASPSAVPESKLAAQPPLDPTVPQVRSVAADPAAGAPVVKPAAAEGTALSPTGAPTLGTLPATGAIIGPTVRPAAAEGGAVSAPSVRPAASEAGASDGAPIVRPSSGDSGGMIRR